MNWNEVRDKPELLHSLLEGVQLFGGDSCRVSHRVAGPYRNKATLAQIAGAIVELLPKLGSELESVRDVVALSLFLDLAKHNLPKVKAWTCRTKYNPKRDFRPGEVTVWSGHFTKAHAESWLPIWKEYLADPKEEHYIWLPIELTECSYSDIRIPSSKNPNERWPR